MCLAAYLRLSKEDDDSNSIKNQRRESLEYINKNQIQTVEEYNEGEGKSGTKDEKERPELNRLMQDIERGKITSIWMRRQDRLARSGLMVLRFAQTIVNHNVKLHFGDKGDVDLTDPIEMFHLTIMAGVDALKPAQQSKGTKKSLLDNFNEGKVWGVYPYGYRTDDDMIPHPHQDEAEIVNRIFEDFLSGKSAHKIAQELNNEKTPTKYSQLKGDLKTKNKHTKKVKSKSKSSIEWSEKTVRDMLSNSWYSGIRYFHKTIKTETTKSGEVPRIVNEILFNKVQKAIKARKGVRTSTPKYNYLLKGLIRCEKCGRNYYARFRPSGRDNYYMCSSYRKASTKCGNKGINIPALESFVIKHLFKSKDLLKMMETITNDNEVLNGVEAEIKSLENNLKIFENKLIRYAKLLGEELVDDELILEQYTNTKRQVEKTKESLIKLKIQKDDLTNSEAITRYKNELSSINDKSDFKTLKQAINKIIENIRIQSLTDANGVYVYIVIIEYKGLNETSTFITKQPYDKWLYVANTRLTTVAEQQELIEEEISLYKFIDESKLTNDVITNIDTPLTITTHSPQLGNVTIEADDFRYFNKIS